MGRYPVSGLCTSTSVKMNLKEVVSKLERFASSSLAESWDNVGLLIEPSSEKTVKTVFLTNDLTEPVLEEALQYNTDLVISYHPPLFRPFKRLTSKSWKERVAVKMVENKVALYSPHTSWDCVADGINSWLVSPYGPGKTKPVSLTTSTVYPGGVSLSMEHIRLAMANGASLESPVRSIAVCAGSGGSVLGGVKADLVVTGEMSHHEVLDFVHKGVSVILADHSNTERGYLN